MKSETVLIPYLKYFGKKMTANATIAIAAVTS